MGEPEGEGGREGGKREEGGKEEERKRREGEWRGEEYEALLLVLPRPIRSQRIRRITI